MGCCAGGHYVIQYRDMLGVDGFDDRKGIFQVFLAFFGGQLGLMGRVAVPSATGQVQRNLHFLGDGSGDFYGLVEAALTVAGFVQRNRYYQVGAFGGLFQVVGQ